MMTLVEALFVANDARHEDPLSAQALVLTEIERLERDNARLQAENAALLKRCEHRFAAFELQKDLFWGLRGRQNAAEWARQNEEYENERAAYLALVEGAVR